MKVRWLGHAGFKFQFPDPSDSTITRTIYIDTWPGGPTFPENAKEDLNDADLICVTHGHFDHSSGAPVLYKNAIDSGKSPKIAVVYELYQFLQEHHKIPEDAVTGMNKGSPVDFGFCTIALVGADHSSSCWGSDGKVCYTGNPVGYIIEAAGKRIYHAGDTNVFSDMEIISELYEPEYAFLPIGGHFTMGPREAAYAIAKYLKSIKTVIPMHFGTFPLLKGTPEQLQENFAHFKTKFNRDDVTFIDPFPLLESSHDLE